MPIGDYEFKTEIIGRPYREGEAKGRSDGHPEGQTEGHVEGYAEGRREVLRGSVLSVLEARGIAVPGAVRERLFEETAPEVLVARLRRAATVSRAEDLFE